MYAARNAQSPALVELMLRNKADVNATDYVSAWEGGGLGWYVFGVTGRWVIVGCSVWVGGIDLPDGRLHSVGKGKGAVEGEGNGAGVVECVRVREGEC